jgi:transcriptional regulator with XRE-family HTH domain
MLDVGVYYSRWLFDRKDGHMIPGSLAERLRVLRAQRGMTLVEAAEQAGVGRDTLSDLERGRRHPVMPTLAKIAEGYGVPVEELLEPVPLGEASETGPTPDQVVEGGGAKSSAVGGGHIYREPTKEEWNAIARKFEDLQHDVAAGEKSKGAAWDTVVGTMGGFKQRA